MILQIAWKNIWRNKLRSGIILGAIAIGLFSGTFLSAFMMGWVNYQIKTDIDQQISHIQIHQKKYMDNHDLSEYFMRNDVAEKLQHIPEIKQVAYRVRINGMLASAANVTGVQINMIDPEEEWKVSTLYETIPDTSGTFFQDSVFRSMPIVISSKTAERLKVRLKSKVVLTFQDMNGEMVSFAFRVSGIFKTTNTMFDEGNIFVRQSDVFASTGLPEGAVHEAAILLNQFEQGDKVTPEVQQLFPDMDVSDWKALVPALALSLSWMDMITFIVLGIFLLALAFGIVNTMLMAVLERTRELGMLMCIGMNKKKVFSMIMLETLFLTLLGSVVGIFAGWLVIHFTSANGMDLSFMIKDHFEDFGFGSIVYPEFNFRTFAIIVVLVFITGILSAIYPALKALKLNPVEAVRQ